jgi:hypothetical protein
LRISVDFTAILAGWLTEGVGLRLHVESRPDIGLPSRGSLSIKFRRSTSAQSRNPRPAYDFNRGAGPPQWGPTTIGHINDTSIHIFDFYTDYSRIKSTLGTHADSLADKGLTLRKETWFSAVMTQRNIHHPLNATARRAARSVVITAADKRVDILTVNVALSALVLVVVLLITSFTGAG